MNDDRNCLSYWFPTLQKAGLPVPKTEIVRWPPADKWGLAAVLDGKEPGGFDVFVKAIADAAEKVGPYPVFLRTGQGSGKHQWDRCCFLRRAEDIPQHVYNLVEWSHLVDFMGLPHDVWAVREMLPTKPLMTLERYGNMPLVREVRAFVGPEPQPLNRLLMDSSQHSIEGVASVVQGLDLTQQFLAERDGLWWDGRIPNPGGPAVSGPHNSLGAWDALCRPDVAAKLYQDFGLATLDAEKGQQCLRCIGGLLATEPPVVERLAALAIGRDNSRSRTSKEAVKNVDPAPGDLLDLDELDEARPNGPASVVQGKRAVGIQKAGAVSKLGRVVLFHEMMSASTGSRSVCAMILHVSPRSKVWCVHSYWPAGAVRAGTKQDVTDETIAAVHGTDQNHFYEIISLLERVAQAFEDDGAWSVDVLETERGYFITDMAEAHRSFHWPECEFARKEATKE